MTDTDRFDIRLEQFLTQEAQRADAYASLDQMIGKVSVDARRRAVIPPRVLALALLALTLLLALALSLAVAGSRDLFSYVLPPSSSPSSPAPASPAASQPALAQPTSLATPSGRPPKPPTPSQVASGSATPSVAVRSPQTAAQSGAIVYAKAGEMHIYDPNTGSDQVVFQEDGIENSPELWSEDGSRIVFNYGYSSNVAADGSDLRTTSGTRYGAWSPDARLYAANQKGAISIEDWSGNVVKKLQLPAGASGVDGLEWSRDGRSLAATVFTCTSASTCAARRLGYLPNDATPNDLSDLWILPVDGSGPRLLVDAVDAFSQVGLDATIPGGVWSPDDSVLALDRNGAIDLIDSATGETQSEIPGVTFQGWSPDGSWLASVNAGALGIVRPDGSDPVPLVELGAVPVWSADGTRIAYFVGDDSATGAVHIVNIDGTEDHVAFEGANNFDWQHLAR